MTKWIYFKWLNHYRNGSWIEGIKILRTELGIELKNAHGLHKFMITAGFRNMSMEHTLWNVFFND